MGYLPIILSLLAFSILWGLVNANSIKKRKKEAEASASLLFRYATLRNTILRQMDHITEVDPTIHTIVHKIQPHLQDHKPGEIEARVKLENEQEITQLISKIPSSVAEEDQNFQNVYKQLLIADNNYRKAATLYRIRLKQYNELTGRYPSRIVAGLLGFRPLQTL